MRHLTVQERARARRLDREGLSLREIAQDLSMSASGVRLVLLRDRGVELAATSEPCFVARAGPLDARSREEIGRGLVRGQTFTAIARHIGRATSTVSREVKANGGRRCYRAVAAQMASTERARRPKDTHLEARPELAEWVIARLQELWSPQEIAAHGWIIPHDPEMRVTTRRSTSRCSCRAGASCAGAHRLSALRTGDPPAPRADRDAGADPRHGDDQRTPRRGGRPCRSRPLGGRPHHR